MYIIENGSIRGNDSSSYEFIDKSEVAARLNFTEEQIEQMMNQLTNTTFDELDDDVLLVPSDSGVSAIPFKSNYTEIFFGSEWCSLNTEYELPTE